MGRILSEEHKRKIGLANSIALLGKVPWNKGIPMSEETKKKLSEYHMGRTAWNKGKKASLESKRKMSVAHKGKKLTDEHKQKIADSERGEKHYNWQGGLSFQDYPQDFTQQLKERIRLRDKNICQLCGTTADEEFKRFRSKLSVNHIDFNKRNCDESNLNTLCRPCNSRINYRREYYTELFQQHKVCSQ